MYNIDGTANLQWYCNDGPGRDLDSGEQLCQPGVGTWGYAPVSIDNQYVTLCDYWFASTWASALCDAPGSTRGTAGIDWTHQPTDQPSVVLHEMLHNAAIVGVENIWDGPDEGGSYTWPQATALAVNAASNNDAPLTNANNFVYLAMAASNASFPTTPCVGCGLTPSGTLCQSSPNSQACINTCQ